ncbi:MAG: hypothetical protein ACKE9I_04400 [Methylophagaceae bacterium]
MYSLITAEDQANEDGTYISNYSGYSYSGSENYEHDNNASAINYSGSQDDVYNAIAMHDGWQEGFDY